jgi:hypothetical protein
MPCPACTSALQADLGLQRARLLDDCNSTASPCFFASLKKWSCSVFLVHAATTGWALQAMGLLIMPAMLLLLLLLDAECAAA